MVAKDTEGAPGATSPTPWPRPNNPEVWMFQAAVLRGQGKRDEALAAFDKVLALKPAHRTAHIEKAYIEIGQGKFAAAKADIDAANKTSPGNLLVTYTQALLDFTQGKNAAARDSLQKVLRSAPTTCRASCWPAPSSSNLVRIQQAEVHLRKYLSSRSEQPVRAQAAGPDPAQGAHPNDAVATLAPLLKAPTQDAAVCWRWPASRTCRRANSTRPSPTSKRRSRWRPKRPALYTSLGLSRSARATGQGVTDLEKATALDPKSTQAGTALVQVQLRLKHYDKALAAVQARAAAARQRRRAEPERRRVPGQGRPRECPRRVRQGGVAAAELFAGVGNLAQLDLQDGKPDAAKQRLEAFLAKRCQEPRRHDGAGRAGDAAGQASRRGHDLARESQQRPTRRRSRRRCAGRALPAHQAAAEVADAGAQVPDRQPTNPDLLDMLGQAQLANNDAGRARNLQQTGQRDCRNRRRRRCAWPLPTR
jgi:tetratricopeptide (TPR) repeat protein